MFFGFVREGRIIDILNFSLVDNNVYPLKNSLSNSQSEIGAQENACLAKEGDTKTEGGVQEEVEVCLEQEAVPAIAGCSREAISCARTKREDGLRVGDIEVVRAIRDVSRRGAFELESFMRHLLVLSLLG